MLVDDGGRIAPLGEQRRQYPRSGSEPGSSKPSGAWPGSTASAARTSESRRSARSAPTKSATKSSAGAASRRSGVSYWTILPSRMIATTSPMRIASSMSWVTKITVFLSRFWVAKISHERSVRALAGWALDRRPAMHGAGLMPGEDMVRAGSGDTDRPTVGRGRRIPVDRLRDHQPAARVGIDQPASGVHLARLAS